MDFTIDEQWLMDRHDHEETTGFVVPAPNVQLSPSPDMLYYRKERASSPSYARSSRHSQSAQISPNLFDSKGASISSFGAHSSKHSRRSARRVSPDVSAERTRSSSKHSRKSSTFSPDVHDRKYPSSPSNAKSSKHSRRGARPSGSSLRKSPESDPETEETVPISISSPPAGQSFSFEINLPPEAYISPLSSYESVIGAMTAKKVDRALENSANFALVHQSPRPRDTIRSAAKASPRDRHQGRQRRSIGDENQERRRSINDSDGDDDENQHRRRSNESYEGHDAQNRRRSTSESSDGGFSRNRDGQKRRRSNASEGLSARGRSNESQYHDRQDRRRSNEFEGHDQQNRRRSNESEGYDRPDRRISNESEGYGDHQQSSRRSNEQDDDEARQRRRRRRRSGEGGQEKQKCRNNERSMSQKKDEAGRRKQKHRSESRARSKETEKQAHHPSDKDSSESSADEERSSDNYIRLFDTDGLKAIVPVLLTPVLLRDSQSPCRQQIMSDVDKKGSERASTRTVLREEMDRVNVSPVQKVVADVKQASTKRSAKLEEIRGGMERAKKSPIRRVLEDVKDAGSKRASRWEELQINLEHVKVSPVDERRISDNYFRLPDTDGLKAIVPVLTPVVFREPQSPRRQQMMSDGDKKGSERASKWTALEWGEVDYLVNVSPVQKVVAADVKQASAMRSAKLEEIRGGMERVKVSPIRRILEDVKDTSSKRASKWEELQRNMERVKASPVQFSRTITLQAASENTRETSTKQPSKWGAVRNSADLIKEIKMATDDSSGRRERSYRRSTNRTSEDASKWEGLRSGMAFIKETKRRSGESGRRRNNRDGSPRIVSNRHVRSPKRDGGTRKKATETDAGEGSQIGCTRSSSRQINEGSSGGGGGSKWSGLTSKVEGIEAGEGTSQRRGSRSSGQQVKDASSGGGGSRKWSGLTSKLVDIETGEGSQTQNISAQVNKASAGDSDGSKWSGLGSKVEGTEAGEGSQRRGNRSSSSQRINEASTIGGGSKWIGLRSKLAETETGEGNRSLCCTHSSSQQQVNDEASTGDGGSKRSGLRGTLAEERGTSSEASQRRRARSSAPQVGEASKWEALKGANAFINIAKQQTDESNRRRNRCTGDSQIVNDVAYSGRRLEVSNWKGLKGASAFINQAKINREQSERRLMQLDESPDVNRSAPAAGSSSTSDSPPSIWSSLRGGVDALKQAQQNKKATGEIEKNAKSEGGSTTTYDGCLLVQPRIKPVILSSRKQSFAWSDLREGIGCFNSESAKVEDQETTAQDNLLSNKWSGLKHAFAFISEAKKKSKERTTSGRDESAPSSSDYPGGKSSAAVSTGSRWDKLNNIISDTKQRAENSRHRRRSMDNAKVENETKRRVERSRRQGRKSIDDVIEESEHKTIRPPAPKVQPHTSIVTPKVIPVILDSSLNSTPPDGRLSGSPSKWAALKKRNDFINNTKEKAKKTTRKETAAQAGDDSKPATKSTEQMRSIEKEASDSREEQAVPASPTWDGIQRASDLINKKKERREDSRTRQKNLDSPTPPIKSTGGKIQFVPSPLVSLGKELDSSQWGSVKVAATGIAPRQSESETSAASGSSSNDPSRWEPLKKQMKDTDKDIYFDASRDIDIGASRDIDFLDTRNAIIGFDAFKDIEFNASREIEVDTRVSDREVDTTADTNRESEVKKDIHVSGLKNEVELKGPGDKLPSIWSALKARLESSKESLDTGDANKESEDKNETEASTFADLNSGMKTKEAGKTGPSHWGILKAQQESNIAPGGAAGSRDRGRASKWNGLKGGAAFINKTNNNLAEENPKKGSKWNGLKGGTAFINKTKKLAEENQKKGSKWNGGLKGGMAFINKTKKLAEENQRDGSNSARTGKRSLWDGLRAEAGEGGGIIKTKKLAEENQKEGSNSARTGKRALWDGLRAEAGEGGGL